jgi:hypothetical protein
MGGRAKAGREEEGYASLVWTHAMKVSNSFTFVQSRELAFLAMAKWVIQARGQESVPLPSMMSISKLPSS